MTTWMEGHNPKYSPKYLPKPLDLLRETIPMIKKVTKHHEWFSHLETNDVQQLSEKSCTSNSLLLCNLLFPKYFWP
jgi:hypothetical protein